MAAQFFNYLIISLCLLISIINAQSTNIDPYKILNVPKHATQKEIRKEFKRLALKYHPDRNVPSSDPDKMKKIAAAYEILGDPAKRKKYDEEQRQNSIFAAHGFRTHSSSSGGGIGAQLTTYNYYNLLYNINDLPWLILAYEDFSQACKQAKSVFEEACIKLQGIARCAKLDVNKESGLISEFNLRRVPHFVIFYNYNGNQKYTKSISWRGREKVKLYTLIDSVADIFPKKCQIIKKIDEMDKFINNYDFNDKYYNKVKAIIFSDAKNRYSPHILLQYLATNFEENIDFAYIHMNTDRPKKYENAVKMAEKVGLDLDELEPPSMYILRSPLIHKDLMKIMSLTNNEDQDDDEKQKDIKLQTLEDIGIYQISLNSDVNSMKHFVEQYSLPLIPKIDSDNYLQQCYLSNSLEGVDEDKICYLFTVQNEDNINNLKRMFLFGQYILASLDESVSFGWINCGQQVEFCETMNIIPSNDNNIKLIAVKAYQDYYQLFNNGKELILKSDQNKNEGRLEKVVKWIGVLEKTNDIIFNDDNGNNNNNNDSICNEDDADCKSKDGSRDTMDDDIIWKKGVLFPVKTPKWSDKIDNVLGGLGGIFGVVGDGVGYGVSTIGSLLSSVFQMFFIIILFVFLLPMLRMAR